MKKIIILVVIIAAFVLKPPPVQAQQFYCEWDNSAFSCLAHRQIDICPVGTDVDDTKCLVATNEAECNVLPVQDCVDLEIDTDPDGDGISDLLWKWENGICTLSDLGTYPTREACEASNRPSTSYKCDPVQHACVVCDPLEDESCILTALSCENICTTPTFDPLCRRSDGQYGIDTAIGCIPLQDSGVLKSVAFFISWAISFSSGVAFLLIIISGILIITSSGNPERLKSGRELLTASISGVLFIIFAIFILRVIGVNALQIFN